MRRGGGADPEPHVDLNQIDHWASRLGCTADELRAAVAANGPKVADIRRYLAVSCYKPPTSKAEADAIEAAGGSPSSLTWPPRPPRF